LKLAGIAEGADVTATHTSADTTLVNGTSAATVKNYALDPAARINAHTTTISGGQITTGSIIAGKLAANSIVTANITTGNITTDTINGNAVTENIGSYITTSGVLPASTTTTLVTLTITTITGSKVMIRSTAYCSSGLGTATVELYRGTTLIRTYSTSIPGLLFLDYLDTPPEGSNTYTLKCNPSTSTTHQIRYIFLALTNCKK